METLELLRMLSEAHGVSGFEDEVRDLVLEEVNGLADDVRVDALGNVLATIRGRRPEVLLLDAHMDEVGFMVGYVEERGFLRLTALGGWDARVLPSHAVTVRTRDGTRVRGVIGTVPPHVTRSEERNRAMALEELFVDIGASSRDDVARMGVGLGDPVVPHYPFERIGSDLVLGKAFDDRAGCTLLIKTLEALRKSPPELTVVGSFTIGEETGLRGAHTAAFQAAPVIALALECTTAADVPGVPQARQPAAMGAGPAITLSDARMVASRPVVRLLEELAAKEGIACQHKLPGFGGTDAGAIHITGAGSMCGVLSVPCRYIHTPLSLLRPSDLDASLRLATAFAREAGALIG